MNSWFLGYLIGGLVVLVVVAVLLLLIVEARRTAEKAEEILSGLHDARDGTAPLWELKSTVGTAERIVAAAASARTSLTPGESP